MGTELNERAWQDAIMVDHAEYGYANAIQIRSNQNDPASGTGLYHIIVDPSSAVTLTTVAANYASAPNGSEVHAPNATVKRYINMGGTWTESGAGATTFYLGDPSTSGSFRLTINASGDLDVDRNVSGTWVNKGSWS